MEQSAHAKIVKAASYPGTYASVFSLPILSIMPEGRAKRLTMDHLASHGSQNEQLAAVRTLSPQYGAEMGREMAAFNPVLQPFTMALGAGMGHATGALRRHRMQRDAEQLALAKAPTESFIATEPIATGFVVTEPVMAAYPAAPPADAEVAQASAVEPTFRR